jgi:predicted enzyme related to lactoylglutathione lyase
MRYARGPTEAIAMASKKAKKKAKAAKPATKVARKVAAKKVPKKKAVARKAPAKRAPRGPAHQVIHWEIQSKVPERLHDFYRDVFSWSIDANNPMKYGMVSSGGEHGIDGGIGGTPGEQSSVVVYVGVPDIDETLAKVHALGGRATMPRTDIGPVIMALFQDPEGNTFGLVES